MQGSNLTSSTIKELLSLPGNDCCCDCASLDTDWACVSYGTVICLECAGKHRALGVNISFVRSLHMDTWTSKQVEIMKHGGNGRFKLYLSMSNLDNSYCSQLYLQHYQSSLGLVYKENLKQHVDNVLNNHIAPTDSLFTSTIMQVGDDFHSNAESPIVLDRDDFWLEDPSCFREISVDFPLGSMGMTLSMNAQNSYTYISKLIENGHAQGKGLYIGDVVIKVGSECITDYNEIKNMIPCLSRPLPITFARKINNMRPHLANAKIEAVTCSHVNNQDSKSLETPRKLPSALADDEIPEADMNGDCNMTSPSTATANSFENRKKSPRFVKQCAGPLFPSINVNIQKEVQSQVTLQSEMLGFNDCSSAVRDQETSATDIEDISNLKSKAKSRVPFSSDVDSEAERESEDQDDGDSRYGELEADGSGNDDHNLSMAMEVINLTSLHESPSWPGTPVGNSSMEIEAAQLKEEIGHELEEVSLEEPAQNEKVEQYCEPTAGPVEQQTPSTLTSSPTGTCSGSSTSSSALERVHANAHDVIPDLPISPHLLRIRQPTMNSWEYDVVFISPPYGFTISRATADTSSSQSMASLLSSTSPTAAVITKLTDRGKAIQQGVELGDTVVAVNNIWTPTYEKVLSVLAQIKEQQASVRGVNNDIDNAVPSTQSSLVVFRLKRSLSYIIGSTTAMIAAESRKVFHETVSFFNSFNSPVANAPDPTPNTEARPNEIQPISSISLRDEEHRPGEDSKANGDGSALSMEDETRVEGDSSRKDSTQSSTRTLNTDAASNLEYEHNTLMDEINRKIARAASLSSPYKSSLEDGSASIIFQSP